MLKQCILAAGSALLLASGAQAESVSYVLSTPGVT